MLSMDIETPSPVFSEAGRYSDQVDHLLSLTYMQLVKIARFHVRFHFLFLTLIGLEVFLIILLMGTLFKSGLFALSLAGLFLTLFGYLTLRQYYLNKKPEQFEVCMGQFLEGCKRSLQYKKESVKDRIFIANCCCKLAALFEGKEYRFYLPPKWLSSLSFAMEKLSCWWYWYDFHFIKEICLEYAVSEHIALVKGQPTGLDFHAALANIYVMQSALYTERPLDGLQMWRPGYVKSAYLKKRFKETAKRAIEEFKILNEYAPEDAWVHMQLAYSYRDLQMPKEEIHEYEILLRLRPEDPDILYTLGSLYFKQGETAKGLQIYEKLRAYSFYKAERLMEQYDAYRK